MRGDNDNAPVLHIVVAFEGGKFVFKKNKINIYFNKNKNKNSVLREGLALQHQMYSL